MGRKKEKSVLKNWYDVYVYQYDAASLRPLCFLELLFKNLSLSADTDSETLGELAQLCRSIKHLANVRL